jgi:hypothetical protein
MRIRAFLAIAGLLIIALPILGDKAAPLSKLTPMSIALALVGVGMVAFIFRWISWRRSEASKQKHKHESAHETV